MSRQKQTSDDKARTGTGTWCGHEQYFDAVVKDCSACSDICRANIPPDFCMQNCPGYYRHHVLKLTTTTTTVQSSATDNAAEYTLIYKPLFWTSVVSMVIALVSMVVIVVMCIIRSRRTRRIYIRRSRVRRGQLAVSSESEIFHRDEKADKLSSPFHHTELSDIFDLQSSNNSRSYGRDSNLLMLTTGADTSRLEKSCWVDSALMTSTSRRHQPPKSQIYTSIYQSKLQPASPRHKVSGLNWNLVTITPQQASDCSVKSTASRGSSRTVEPVDIETSCKVVNRNEESSLASSFSIDLPTESLNLDCATSDTSVQKPIHQAEPSLGYESAVLTLHTQKTNFCHIT